MRIDTFQIEATRRRYEERKTQRERNLQLVKEGRYFAVDTPERVSKFLTRRDFSPQEAARLIEEPRGVAAAAEAGGREWDALERMIGTSDLMGVAFPGARAAGCTPRLAAYGSAWQRGSRRATRQAFSYRPACL